MSWLELKKFIEKMDGPVLYSEVKLYDFATGDEYNAGMTELLIGDSKEDDDCGGWIPYLSINEEEIKDVKVKETGVN